MNLGKQIQTLLKRQPAVCVKGLGTFRRNHHSASFDAKRNVYLPPMTYIEFEGDSSDGFNFVAYIQQIQQIDRQQAEAQVDGAVSAVLNNMQQHGEATLDSLGYLVSYGASFVFKPLDLSGFQFNPVVDEYNVQDRSIEVHLDSNTIVDKNDPSSLTNESVNDEQLVEAITTQQENSLPPLPIRDEDLVQETNHPQEMEYSDEYHHEEKSNNALIYIIVAVLSLITLGGLYYYNMINNAPAESTPIEDPAVVLPDTISDLDTSVIQLDTAISSSDTLSIRDTITEDVPIVVEEVKKYTIIIGTHKSLADATADAESYHKKGHKTVKVMTPNLSKNNKRVVWDTYATKEERDSALAYVRKHVKADAWPDVVR